MSQDKLIMGVDICQHAIEIAKTDNMPSWEEVQGCPVCLRKWRMFEAINKKWTPLSYSEAEAMLDDAAKRFDSNPSEDVKLQGFYARIARDRELESDFACAVASYLVPKDLSIPPAPKLEDIIPDWPDKLEDENRK